MVVRAQSARANISCGLRDVAGESVRPGPGDVRRIPMTPGIMRQYLAAHAPELEHLHQFHLRKGRCSMSTLSLQRLRALLLATILAGALAGSAMAQPPDASCALPSEPEGIPAALDAALTGRADQDRACMKALLIPEARLTFLSIAADGAPSYRLETLDDWIARVKARGHAMLAEKQLKCRIERYGNIAHVWSSYTLQRVGKAVLGGRN